MDTSVLLEFLGVPDKTEDQQGHLDQLDEKAGMGTTLLISITAVIETGAHVGNIVNGDRRRECATALSNLIRATLDPSHPWKFEPVSWDEELLKGLIDSEYSGLPTLIDSVASKFLQMGDRLILGEYKRLTENLDARIVDIDVWTKDTNLRGVVDSIRSGGTTAL